MVEGQGQGQVPRESTLAPLKVIKERTVIIPWQAGFHILVLEPSTF